MFNSQEIVNENYVDANGQPRTLKSKITGLGNSDIDLANSVFHIQESTYEQSLDGKTTTLATVTVDLSPANLKKETWNAIKANKEVSFTMTVTDKADQEVGSVEINGTLADAQMEYAETGSRQLVISGVSGTFKIGNEAGQIGGEAAAAA